MKVTYIYVLTGIFLAILVGCAASSAAQVRSGSRVHLRLYDARSQVSLALANETHPEYQEVYSHRRADASLKLLPDPLMGELLAALDRAGFARYSQPTEAPVGGAVHDWVLLQRDGRTLFFDEPPSTAPAAERQAFAMIKLLLGQYYSAVSGLQFVENRRGDDFFGDGH